jgi:hypothetical protein
MLEAMIEVADGHCLDDVLKRYASIPLADYRRTGASEMEGLHLHAVAGGRR